MMLHTEQTELDLYSPSSPEAAREAYCARLVKPGFRPPQRWEVLPEDLAPPVRERRGLNALFHRILNRLSR